MKGEIRISKSRQAYFPRIVVNSGFKGVIPFYMNASTLTLTLPEASLEDIEQSLEIVLADLRLRRQLEEKGGTNGTK